MLSKKNIKPITLILRSLPCRMRELFRNLHLFELKMIVDEKLKIFLCIQYYKRNVNCILINSGKIF